MFRLQSIVAGIRALFRKKEVEQEMDEELRGYLDAAVKEKMRLGMSQEQALRAARVEMGSMDAVKEEIRSAGWESKVETLWQDVRYGLRQLKRNPGFTVVVVITLALGIGANSTVFSVLNGFFLRALPVPEPERLVAFSNTSFSWADYMAFRDQAKSFASLSTSFGFPFTANLNSTRPPQHIYGGLVTANFLTTLGIKPALGRGFLPDEDQISSPKPVVMLSYQFRRTRFGGDPGILGNAIRLNNASYTVVGVMPSDLRTVDIGMAPDLWAPMATLPQLESLRPRPIPSRAPSREFWIFGRLKPGVSRQEAHAELNVINDRLHNAAGKKEKRPIALATAGVLPGELGKMFLGVSSVVMVIAGLVLLIACVNIANLLLARGTVAAKGNSHSTGDWRRPQACDPAIDDRKPHSCVSRRRRGIIFGVGRDQSGGESGPSAGPADRPRFCARPSSFAGDCGDRRLDQPHLGTRAVGSCHATRRELLLK